MKKLIMALIAAMTMTVGAMAQDSVKVEKVRRQRPEVTKTDFVKHRTGEFVKKYGLSEEQAQQLLELNTKYADRMGQGRGPRQGGNGPRPGMRENRKPLQADSLQKGPRPQRGAGGADMQKLRGSHEAYNAELKTILTEEQFKAYQEDEVKRFKEGPRSGQRQRQHRDDNNK